MIQFLVLSFVVLLSRGQTTTEEATEETTTVVTEAPTTTENPANFPKDGEVELLVEDLLHSGYMMHWSSNQGYLVMADIWGQRYIRFREKDPVTTTVVPEVTTLINKRRRRQEETTTTEIAVEETTTTEIPTTTAEPLPYDLHYMTIPAEVVYLIRPRDMYEGSYPIIVPLHDQFNATGESEESNIALIGFNDKLHVATWNLTEPENILTYQDWSRINAGGRIRMPNFMIPSPAWIDNDGRMVVADRDIRPFQHPVTQSEFYVLPNNLEPEWRFDELRQFSSKANGMAWSVEGDSLFYADGVNKAVYKCNYDQKKFNASDCSELFNVGQEIHEDAEPMGLAVDTSDHVWLLIGNNEDKGALIELDPETGSIVSNIELEDSKPVDLTFAGEDLDFLYIMSDKHLYKVSGLGVTGKPVPDFIWKPDY